MRFGEFILSPYSCLPSIYDIATSDHKWTEALDQIAQSLNSSGAIIYAANSSQFDYEVNHVNSYYHNKMEEVFVYLERFQDFDKQGIMKLFSSPVFDRIDDLDVWPDLDLEKGREDLDFLRASLGVGRRAGFNLTAERGWNATLTLQYDKDIIQPDKGGMENSRILVPHLGKAIELNRFYSQLRKKYNAVLSVLDKVKIGICLASPSGEILISNQQCQSLFDNKDGLYLDHHSELFIPDEDILNKIRENIRQCSATAAGEHTTRTIDILVGRTSGKDPYLLTISPLRDGENEFERSFSGAMIMIVDPDNPPQIASSPAAKVFNLTKTEVEVADLLLKGHNIGEIADIRNVTFDTTKNQCKSIYSKMSVSNRTNLVKRLISLCPPII